MSMMQTWNLMNCYCIIFCNPSLLAMSMWFFWFTFTDDDFDHVITWYGLKPSGLWTYHYLLSRFFWSWTCHSMWSTCMALIEYIQYVVWSVEVSIKSMWLLEHICICTIHTYVCWLQALNPDSGSWRRIPSSRPLWMITKVRWPDMVMMTDITIWSRCDMSRFVPCTLG